MSRILQRKEGDIDVTQEKEEGKLPMSMKQRNPDIGESAGMAFLCSPFCTIKFNDSRLMVTVK